MNFQVELTPRAARALRKLPTALRDRITASIRALGDDPWPPGSRRLATDPDRSRIRVGDYRVLYRVVAEQRLVQIEDIGRRDEVYRPR